MGTVNRDTFATGNVGLRRALQRLARAAGLVGASMHTEGVDPHSRPTQLIGAGAANFGREASYYASLSQMASTSEDVLAHLDRQIETARTKLERCLKGHDSFDALAFLRFAAGPLDFTSFKESETLIETSQTVQDVIALTFLGMGLPRTPLTGENSGQPDLGEAVTQAAQIIRAANAKAMIRGHRLKEPLGPLAGDFLAYELSVRGRQYTSIAAELNTDLLEDQSVESIIADTLGFTLQEVRDVREAAVTLLNERFFGARDRVGDAAQAGSKVDSIDRDSFLADMNLMLNECRLFGAVAPSDVAARAGIAVDRVITVLDFFSARRSQDGAPHPVTEFASGRVPTPWGAIADDDGYLLLNGFLGEDELRRDIERGLKAASRAGGSSAKAWVKYDRRRAAFSEATAANTFATLLGGTQPVLQGQHYVGPEDLADVAMFCQESDLEAHRGRDYESDALFVIDGVAVCVEVKAGAVTEKSRSGHAQRLASDLEKTLKQGNEQAQRLVELIRTNRGVWTADGQWVDLSAVSEIHSVLVMLDDMGPLSLSMNELAQKGIITSTEVPWIVSLHDLVVISRVFDHPAQFLDFLRRRRGRKLATMLSAADELDVLMWFLDGGMYFDPDPVDVAAQLPIDRPIKKSDQRRFDDQPRVRLGTLTDPLDAWMYGQEGLSQVIAPKPTRREAPWVEEFLGSSERSQASGWLRFGADLVGLGGQAQRRIGRDLKEQCRNARGGVRERSLTTHGTTAVGSWLLTAAAIPPGAETGHLPEYIDAKQYQTHSSCSMLLLYRTDGRLFGSRFRGEPEPRSAERDAEIAISPLHSLASTFTTVPPSARRRTKQLRGKNTKRKRR